MTRKGQCLPTFPLPLSPPTIPPAIPAPHSLASFSNLLPPHPHYPPSPPTDPLVHWPVFLRLGVWAGVPCPEVPTCGCRQLASQTTHRPSLRKPHSSQPRLRVTATRPQPWQGASPSAPETLTRESPPWSPRERPDVPTAYRVTRGQAPPDPHTNISIPSPHIVPSWEAMTLAA